jgi:hypothetical protein
MKTLKSLLILCLLTLSACSTIRMKYESTVVFDNNDRQKFVYVNSYPVGGAHAVLCGATAIFLGGYCWFYLVMPTTIQTVELKEEAAKALTQKAAGKQFEERRIFTERVGFSEGQPEVYLGGK